MFPPNISHGIEGDVFPVKRKVTEAGQSPVPGMTTWSGSGLVSSWFETPTMLFPF